MTCCTREDEYGWPTVRRYARTLTEAYGPYTSKKIDEPKGPSLLQRIAKFFRRFL